MCYEPYDFFSKLCSPSQCGTVTKGKKNMLQKTNVVTLDKCPTRSLNVLQCSNTFWNKKEHMNFVLID